MIEHDRCIVCGRKLEFGMMYEHIRTAHKGCDRPVEYEEIVDDYEYYGYGEMEWEQRGRA